VSSPLVILVLPLTWDRIGQRDTLIRLTFSMVPK